MNRRRKPGTGIALFLAEYLLMGHMGTALRTESGIDIIDIATYRTDGFLLFIGFHLDKFGEWSTTGRTSFDSSTVTLVDISAHWAEEFLLGSSRVLGLRSRRIFL